MAARPSPPASQEPVHAFRPTSGAVLGVAGLVAAAAVLLLVALTERSVTGLRVALVAGGAAVLIWMVLLRPRVAAFAETLLLRNMARDTHLPLAEIDTVVVRHTLNVWVGDQRFTSPGDR